VVDGNVVDNVATATSGVIKDISPLKVEMNGDHVVAVDVYSCNAQVKAPGIKGNVYINTALAAIGAFFLVMAAISKPGSQRKTASPGPVLATRT
jgi:hypothetical protein